MASAIARRDLEPDHSNAIALTPEQILMVPLYRRRLKRGLDFAGALLALVAFGPLMIFLAVALKASQGSVFYRQMRIGADGRPFTCLKFQTMVGDADRLLETLLRNDPIARRQWRLYRKLLNDPRVTPVGRFIRTWSLDELPQLFNVLRGDMSLIGPRPIIESEKPLYGPALILYAKARPGITGLWQVSGRNDVDYARRVALDVDYVGNWSLRLDWMILMRTIGVVVSRSGAY
jgi:lipopolysaccharide/colanic/teichoic acid biosynthesis glycosyltransferase